jgi:hypothetical protein
VPHAGRCAGGVGYLTSLPRPTFYCLEKGSLRHNCARDSCYVSGMGAIGGTRMSYRGGLSIVLGIMLAMAGCASEDASETSDVTVRGTIQGVNGPVEVGLLLIRQDAIRQVAAVQDTFANNGPFHLSTPLPEDTSHIINWGLTICASPPGQACAITSDNRLEGAIRPGTLAENVVVACTAASPCEEAQFACFQSASCLIPGGGVIANLSCHLDGTPSPAFICCRSLLAFDITCQ